MCYNCKFQLRLLLVFLPPLLLLGWFSTATTIFRADNQVMLQFTPQDSRPGIGRFSQSVEFVEGKMVLPAQKISEALINIIGIGGEFLNERLCFLQSDYFTKNNQRWNFADNSTFLIAESASG